MSPSRLTPLDFQTAAIEQNTGTFTTRWEMLLRALFGDVAAVASLPAIVNRFAFAAQPSLGASDEGYIAFETTYGHLLRWTGAVWEFAPGDPGNGYFEDFAIAPQAAGWKLCDGTLTDYLTVGAALLTVTAITPPNLSGAYRKGGAAYTGLVVAATGAGLSGSTAADGDHNHGGATGASAAGVAIAHTTTPLTVDSGAMAPVSGFLAGNVIDDGVQTHPIGASGTHGHAAGSLAVDATAEPAHVAARVYFRR